MSTHERHAVYVETLQAYSQKLAGEVQRSEEIAGLVAQSDVSNESWGLIGLAVKLFYSDMLTDLEGLLHSMSSGLRSASDKIGNCAQVYQEMEDQAQGAFEAALKELERSSYQP